MVRFTVGTTDICIFKFNMLSFTFMLIGDLFISYLFLYSRPFQVMELLYSTVCYIVQGLELLISNFLGLVDFLDFIIVKFTYWKESRSQSSCVIMASQ